MPKTKEYQITNYNYQDQSNKSQINICLHNLFTPLIKKVYYYQNQTADDSCKKISISNIPINHVLSPLINLNETVKKRPAIIIDIPKVDKKSIKLCGWTSKGEMPPAENQATAMFPVISEALSNWREDNLSTEKS